jgi:leucyl/phenylalanyl-tRNA--protein transferase
MVFRLSPDLPHLFPDPELADDDGLLAVEGDLSPERLVAAYQQGIFPWFDAPPYLWWSPDPRCVILPEDLHIPRRLGRLVRSGRFTIRLDAAFAEVCKSCARTPRPGQGGTWITPEMFEAYVRLHRLGLAHSVEAWQGDRLVGGLYGVGMGRAFFGESMFHLEPDASKAAFARFALDFFGKGGLFIDCQQVTPHMLRFGARAMPRREFLDLLREALSE